jgi:hypothetical protein
MHCIRCTGCAFPVGSLARRPEATALRSGGCVGWCMVRRSTRLCWLTVWYTIAPGGAGVPSLAACHALRLECAAHSSIESVTSQVTPWHAAFCLYRRWIANGQNRSGPGRPIETPVHCTLAWHAIHGMQSMACNPCCTVIHAAQLKLAEPTYIVLDLLGQPLNNNVL